MKIKEGLPDKLLRLIPPSGEHFPDQHRMAEESVREAYLCDSTQVRTRMTSVGCFGGLDSRAHIS